MSNDVTLNIKKMRLEDYINLAKDQRTQLLPYSFEERMSILITEGIPIERAFEYAKETYLKGK